MRSLITSLGSQRSLLFQLWARDYSARYRGGLLGVGWAVINPIIMLVLYSFVFVGVFKMRWQSGPDVQGNFVILLFTGLIVHTFFAEFIVRAPVLVTSHVAYVKKVIFPLEFLPLMPVFGALLNFFVGLVLVTLLLFYLQGSVPLTIFLVPVIIAPYTVMVLGFTYFLSAIGVFLRDLAQLVGLLTTFALFASPVLYPLENVPERFRDYLYLNPLTLIVEQIREVAILGVWPNWWALAAYTVVSLVVFELGLIWFQKSARALPMSSDVLIEAHDLSKVYMLYGNPQDRLKQMILPRLRRWFRIFGRSTEVALYTQFWALKNVSLEVRRGETLGIVGQNGSGKSTLLQMVCGTLHPTEGTRRTEGRVAALLELGAGFNPDYTGRENVYLNAALYGLNRSEVDERMTRIVEFAEIGIHIDQPVKTYSSGMFVRLAFSVIANIDADVLIIDEALAVGDASFQQKCMRFLRNFQKKGAILFVSHDTGAMMNFCDRVVWLHKGEVKAQGEPRRVCEEYLGFLYQQNSEPTFAPPSEAVAIGGGADQAVPPIDAQVPTGSVGALEGPSAETPAFNADSRSFGDGGAQITGVELRGVDGQPLSAIAGGETTELTIIFQARRNLVSVISGFIVKDRLGQYIFGDNTFATTQPSVLSMQPNQSAFARFRFQMPSLAAGPYAIAVAVASGTLKSHVQHHWMHEGLVFNVFNDRETGVLLGIPMESVALEALPRS